MAALISSSAAITPDRATIPNGKPFYGPYEAQEVFKKHEADIGVTMVPFSMMVYLEEEDRYVPDDEVQEGRQGSEHFGHGIARPAE